VFEDDVHFKEYYDLNKDPEQLDNMAYTLSNEQQAFYQKKIKHFKNCSGRECSFIGYH